VAGGEIVKNKPEGVSIPEIWITAEEKSLSIGHKNRPEIEGASQFESVCKVNGNLYKAVITIRKGIDDIAKFRYYTLKNMQLLPA
jgi:hypothetical protein